MTGAASLRIDGDDLIDVIVEIERSFAIKLPSDLGHVRTAGDLHREIVATAGPASGDTCPTSEVFYALRRMLAASGARPETPLASLGLGSPRTLRRLLAGLTDWSLPVPAVGPVGCVALLLGPTAMALGWWISNPWILVASPVLALTILLRLDPGSWSGSWSTLGTLSRAVAATNHARLAGQGARHSPATTWHALVALLQDVLPEHAQVTPDSLLCANLEKDLPERLGAV